MPTDYERNAGVPRQPDGRPAQPHPGGMGASADPPGATGTSTENDQRTEQLRQQAESLGRKARERGLGMVDEQKAVAARQIDSLSRALHDTAERMQGEEAGTARYLRQAADGLGRLGDGLRQRDAGDLYNQAAGFVRRQPGVVFAGALAAGFFLTRFLKAEPPEQHRDEYTGVSGDTSWQSGYGSSRPSPGQDVEMPGIPTQGREH